MNSRAIHIADEHQKHHYIEMQTDLRKRSVIINASSNGGYVTVVVDMSKLKQAMAEMNG